MLVPDYAPISFKWFEQGNVFVVARAPNPVFFFHSCVHGRARSRLNVRAHALALARPRAKGGCACACVCVRGAVARVRLFLRLH